MAPALTPAWRLGLCRCSCTHLHTHVLQSPHLSLQRLQWSILLRMWKEKAQQSKILLRVRLLACDLSQCACIIQALPTAPLFQGAPRAAATLLNLR